MRTREKEVNLETLVQKFDWSNNNTPKAPISRASDMARRQVEKAGYRWQMPWSWQRRQVACDMSQRWQLAGKTAGA